MEKLLTTTKTWPLVTFMSSIHIYGIPCMHVGRYFKKCFIFFAFAFCPRVIIEKIHTLKSRLAAFTFRKKPINQFQVFNIIYLFGPFSDRHAILIFLKFLKGKYVFY